MSGRKNVFELFVRIDEEWMYVTDLRADTKADALLMAVVILKQDHAELEMKVQEKSSGPNDHSSHN